MRIFKSTDRVKIKIDDVTITVTPFTYEQKIEVQSIMLQAAEGNIIKGIEGAKLALKYSLKEIEGVELMDGSSYELELENGVLTDECVEELLNSEITTKLTLISIALLTGIKSEFLDPQTGKKLEGVSLVKNSKRTRKK